MNNNIHALYQAILNDPKARAEIAGAATSGDRVDFILARGKALGLPVTREEVERFVSPPPDGDLSDLDLEMVVGGKNQHLVGADSNLFTLLLNCNHDDLYGGSGDDTI